jgi:hypothetical protein
VWANRRHGTEPSDLGAQVHNPTTSKRKVVIDPEKVMRLNHWCRQFKGAGAEAAVRLFLAPAVCAPGRGKCVHACVRVTVCAGGHMCAGALTADRVYRGLLTADLKTTRPFRNRRGLMQAWARSLSKTILSEHCGQRAAMVPHFLGTGAVP